jgi:adenine-specific DNA-methyltransferase
MHAAQKQEFLRKLRPLTTMVKERARDCRRLLETMIVEWTHRNYPSVPCVGFHYDPAMARRDEVAAFVDWLSSLSFLEGSYWLSSVYALWAGVEHRKRHAVFFTPPSLTKRLLDDLVESGVSFARSTFIDPACGGAAFLAPIAERIRDELTQLGRSDAEIVEHVTTHVHGTDIDERLCGLSRHFIRIVLRNEIALANLDPAFRISRADSLVDLHARFGTFDVVVSNPPYRKMTAHEVAAAGSDYESVVQSQPNLYGLFIALCIKLLRPLGHAALVTPTSFLTGQYFTKLRQVLSNETQVRRIGMVSDRRGVFIDVEQETALTILQRRERRAGIAASTVVSVVARDGSYRSVGPCALSPSGEAWPVPRSESDLAVLSSLGRLPFRIADYGYRVRIGAFVWNRDVRPSFFLKEIRRRAGRDGAVPLLWSSDIGAGGRLKYGNKAKAHIEPSWVDFGAREHSGVIKNPSVLLQRVTSNDQPKRLVGAVVSAAFIAKYGGFVAENHVVVLEQVRRDAAVSPTAMVRLLGSQVIDRYFRCISGSTNVSAYELALLPLPDPDSVALAVGRGAAFDTAVEDAVRVWTADT